jgi:hypothetical protein
MVKDASGFDDLCEYCDCGVFNCDNSCRPCTFCEDTGCRGECMLPTSEEEEEALAQVTYELDEETRNLEHLESQVEQSKARIESLKERKRNLQ